MADRIFVGRGDDLDLLTSELDLVRAGQPRVVLVDGEPGIGKTALIRRFLSGADALVLHASGDEAEADLPFAVLDQLLRGVTAELPAGLASLVSPDRITLDPVIAGSALVDLVGELQVDQPVIAVIDDLHWADLPSMQALSFAARRLMADRLLLVIVSRTGEQHRIPAGLLELTDNIGAHLSLTGLTPGQLGELADAIGTALSAGAAAELHEHTRGNPLYATALIRDGLPTGAHRAGVPLPAPAVYADLVRRTLGRCSEATRRLVGALSVIGLSAALSMTAAVAALSDPVPALDDAVDAQLLDVDGQGPEQRVAFTHPLVRAAVYFDLAPHLRRELHLVAAARAADRMAALGHRVLAATGPDEPLATELRGFAEDEAVRGSSSSASWAMRAAARLSADRGLREGLMLRAIEFAVLAGDAATVESEAEAIAGFRDTPRARYVAGMLAVATGQRAEGERLLLSALDGLGFPPEDPELAGAIGGWLAPLFINGGRSGESLAWAREAITRGMSGPLDWPNLALAPVALAGCGHATEALQLTEPIHSRADLQRTDIDLLTGRAVVGIWNEHLDGAWRDLHQVLAATQDRGPFVDRLIAYFYLGDVAYRLGRLDDAITYGGLAASAGHDADQAWVWALVHAVASWPLAARGDWAQATFHAEASTAAAEALGRGDLGAAIWSAMARARLAHARHDHQGVVTAIVGLYDSTFDDGLWDPGIQPWEAMYAEALVRTDQLDKAESALHGLEGRLGDGSSKRAAADAARVRGVLLAAQGDDAAAEEAFTASVSGLTGVEATLLLARNEGEFGKFLRRRGKRRDAVTHLLVARDGFGQLGALPYLGEVTEELVAAGHVDLTQTSEPRSVMTPQETAVANLASHGLSNKEIAAQLVISVKTVEYHLSHVYTKLAVRSRTELTRLLVEGRSDAQAHARTAPPPSG
jgi:DNA-binding CsgD family transcriptional regulator/tetratricopeptide (TPR) repeat protein